MGTQCTQTAEARVALGPEVAKPNLAGAPRLAWAFGKSDVRWVNNSKASPLPRWGGGKVVVISGKGAPHRTSLIRGSHHVLRCFKRVSTRTHPPLGGHQVQIPCIDRCMKISYAYNGGMSGMYVFGFSYKRFIHKHPAPNYPWYLLYVPRT